ncbi:hypothetical protein DYBT9275_01448 [Dyadobacter sp. CECT 9275]|uniref:Cupin domain-containing protein n=1 Tax=Dyadobacter helix TaxID=2822344 RepID=A0A916JAK2_9BACT|nr:hypothetical protein [Dyadobacter sp. CECT 9275]CAG4994702.1 hypothetical protein DYBT9275_01448 [Dyadobacter sp. CECT 9275]
MNTEIKSNHPTENRPQGKRILDAPYVFIDTPGFIEQLRNEKTWEKNDRNGITVFKSDKLAMVITAMKSGAVMKDYSVEGFSSIEIYEGEVRIETEGQVFDLTRGQSMVYHPGLVHSVKASSDAVIVQTTFCS